MNDFDYDCLQKKKVARSAAYKKRGSHSKACSLPSDHLTNKQWKDRCGEMISYSLSEPMEWKTFKKLPKDAQEEYLRNLQNRFSANSSNIGEMFGVAPTTIRRHIAMNNIDIEFKVGHSMSNRQRELWEAFIHNGPTEIEKEENESPEEENEEQVEVIDAVNLGDEEIESGAQVSNKMGIEKFEISFSGTIDTAMIANSLYRILGKNTNGKVQVSCEILN